MMESLLKVINWYGQGQDHITVSERGGGGGGGVISLFCNKPFIESFPRYHLTLVIQHSNCAVDDLMHYCTRPKAECKSASGRPRYRGVIV